SGPFPIDRAGEISPPPECCPMHRVSLSGPSWAALLIAVLALTPTDSHAFCGFYVARADAKLYNQSSRVVLVRDHDRTVMTMANDYQGDLKEFAMVVPVPTFIEREQIHVADPALIDHLDAYSAPRLVEYFDEDPCMWARMEKDAAGLAAPQAVMGGAAKGDPRAGLG